MPDDLALRKKRLLYRASHRGTQELDILIGGYVTAHLAGFDSPMLDRLETLLDTEETDLSAWLMGQRPVPADVDSALIAAMRAYREQQAKAQK